ncbi:MAG: peptidoglycan DD-metalloendopeptidase family protein [Chloroflexi bacterium]|nr:peptidoglycan DD-metalloendopeptidase family protein [Chloroflexota bacterium]
MNRRVAPHAVLIAAVGLVALIAGIVGVWRLRAPLGDAPPPTARPATRVPAVPTPPVVTPRPTPMATARPVPTATVPASARRFDDQRLNYAPGVSPGALQAWLDRQPGTLGQLTLSVGGRRHTFAEVLIGQTSYYSVNPHLVLALLELQGALLSDPAPTADQFTWAAGYRGEAGNRAGLQAQVRWAVRQILHARRDYPAYAPLTYADGSEAPPPAGLTLAEYALARLLAPTTTPDALGGRMARLVDVYASWFGDPRSAPDDWPAPAAPFLVRPTDRVYPVTSFFDHNGPFLTRNRSEGIHTYWGRTETNIAFAYNGHDGWDYAASPPAPALAAAAGEVYFAGNADDGCATGAVIVDHENGYRTLYWHLERIDVAIGDRVAAGDPVGIIGNTGCSLGPHLHFGVQYLGRNVDPYGWCGADADPWAMHPAGAASRWLWSDRPSPCDAPPADARVLDESRGGFLTDSTWREAPTGVGGTARFAASRRSTALDAPWKPRPATLPAAAAWRLAIDAPARYQVSVYIPYALSDLGDARQLRFVVHHADGISEVLIDGMVYANEWAPLGSYTFDDAVLITIAGIAEAADLTVWADAVMLRPAPAGAAPGSAGPAGRPLQAQEAKS